MSEGAGRIAGLQVSDGGAPKYPIESAEVTPVGLVGDRQRDLRNHGGPERALCLFSLERIEALKREGHPIYPGAAAENVTIEGLDWSSVLPGSRYRLGDSVTIEITRYTTPCSNIAPAFKDGDISRILQQKHPGDSRVYARVLTTGSLKVGDPVTPL